MAISIAQQYYSDLTTLADPLRMLQGFDYFGHSDQMEFSISTGLDEVRTEMLLCPMLWMNDMNFLFDIEFCQKKFVHCRAGCICNVRGNKSQFFALATGVMLKSAQTQVISMKGAI